ncbi:DNA-binding response regulator, LytR/AlgR family [Algoriphagus locisalis]|uniref:DNA-binding response regulator, LytR/AlgR family n=1 Tax=Algoriphagus locisalis TaxID=305507 RepID=A0A1I7EA73_9BACT|nr:LytTR family DNA-binding domain-containing protein [Algoriphagus locisalis]SFU20866.1 DNA-binding response regulator, LytR/AlgR family [Algoriphagus locisalis]
MIKILLLEDELPARKKIKRYLDELQLDVKVTAEIESVQAGIEYLESLPALDLIISDIELRDGNAFEIFQNVTFTCPIIFTTAYNEFWMEAFESNGIAYLLKPFSLEKFEHAWAKFQLLTQQPSNEKLWFKQFAALIEEKNQSKKEYKSRFTIPTTKGNYFISVEEIVYFSAEDGLVYGIEKSGKKHLMKETTLKEIESRIDPDIFFRINRSQLVNKKTVTGTERYTKNSIAIKLAGVSQLLVCSQSQTPEFLNWIEK